MTEVWQDRPVLIFDADCAFCTRCVEFMRHHMPTSADIKAFQFTDLTAYGTDENRASHELLWVNRNGRVDGGAQAVARMLIDCGGGYAAIGGLMRYTPVRWLAHGVYRAIANNRQRMPGGTAACALPAHK